MRLSELIPSLSTKQRDELAAKAGTSAAYLWQLSTRWRDKKPSIDLLQKLAAVDRRLTVGELVEEFSAESSAPKRSPKQKAEA